MKLSRWLLALLISLAWTNLALADVVETSPYPYARPPSRGVEKGTYAFNGSGPAGPDCFVTLVGAARFLPNAARTGGRLCAKANLQAVGAGPVCAAALASGANQQVFVFGGPYTYNPDGTICENLKIIGGSLDGQPITAHDYVSNDGNLILPTAESIDYPCPNLPHPQNGVLAGPAVLFKISKVGDDPAGSGSLACVNP